MPDQITFEFNERPTIKGFPELRWTGKRPFRSTQYFPAQIRERYGEEYDRWINRIFWGDNLQVMSHLLKEFRGKVDLIYIDPPFDSKADYKKKIEIRGIGDATSDSSFFEEKQYGDIWTNDEYLQFMYERLIVMRELLSDTGSIYLHCDWHKSHYLRSIMDEIFGFDNFRNEMCIHYTAVGLKALSRKFHQNTETVMFYVKNKSSAYTWNIVYEKLDEPRIASRHAWKAETGKAERVRDENGTIQYFEVWENKADNLLSLGEPHFYSDVSGSFYEVAAIRGTEKIGYPTQKSEKILERIIEASSNPGDLVFDCFMGSGTTQAVAMRLGRRFIGADINLGAIQTTTKRLISLAAELVPTKDPEEKQVSLMEKNVSDDDAAPIETTHYTGFEVYNVNNYEFFRNPLEARDLLIEALEIQPFPQSDVWDGELDGRMVKIMPVNRIATKADLEELKANLPYKIYEKRKEEHPTLPVEKITIVCMGHKPNLKASLEAEFSGYKVDIEIVDILRDKADLQLKRDSEADIAIEGGQLVIRAFYPLNLMQKLSLQKEFVEDWRQLVESIMVDWNYDGVVMQPSIMDVPSKKEMVKGIYEVPAYAGTIKVKITDLLSESLETEVR